MVRHLLVALLVAALCLAATPTATATSHAPPVVAFLTATGDVRTATLGGDRLRSFAGLSSFSLKGNLLVGEKPGGGLVGYHARTGEQLFTVAAARLPTVLDSSGRVAFWAEYERDKQTNSVWIREADGRVRKVVQFSNGGDLPGYDPGFHGDAIILNTSFDRAARKLVLAEGNDVDLFAYDIFVVDVASGRVRRLTDDKVSRWPSMSPDGRRVAYQRETAACGPDYVRAARLVVENIDGTGAHVLTTGDCNRWLSNPRWVSRSKIVAYRWDYRSAQDYDVDLVLINVDTGRRRRLTHSGRVSVFSVNAVTHRVAFERRDTTGFWILSLDEGTRRAFRGGRFPHLAGEVGTL